MNVFTLFEDYDFESTKLGIQVIKTLSYQKEFGEKMYLNFEVFNELFEDYVLNKKDRMIIPQLMFQFYCAVQLQHDIVRKLADKVSKSLKLK